jgi:hypothetical protein
LVRLGGLCENYCRIIRDLGSGIVSECHTSLIRCLDSWAIRWPITFSRNVARDFTQYLSERPEMSFSLRAVASAKAAKREIKEGQNKKEK